MPSAADATWSLIGLVAAGASLIPAGVAGRFYLAHAHARTTDTCRVCRIHLDYAPLGLCDACQLRLKWGLILLVLAIGVLVAVLPLSVCAVIPAALWASLVFWLEGIRLRVLGTEGDAPRCSGCGYNLRGLDRGRCPECGLPFAPGRLCPPAGRSARP